MGDDIGGVKDIETVKEFEENGYSPEEIEEMGDEKFVYTAVCLVDGMNKLDINKSLRK